jgi:polysaccharide pyruvyl transferase WcaK-like protein
VLTATISRKSTDSLAIPLARAVTRAPRIGVIYPSGWGNLGDEAIMQATFDGLRERWPNVELRAFTLHPQRTAANHRVDAEFLTGVNLPMFLSPRGDGPFIVRAAKGVARRTRTLPILGRAFEIAADVMATVVFEAVSLKSAWRWLKTADLLLAAGGGQLDAVWGGTWGQPYALARWAWLARRAGVPFAFLSVGYGRARTRMSKRLLRYAVSRASYCSVRDSGSRALTQQLGVTSDLPVVPDLAFGLRTKAPLRPRRPGYDIGISPMAFMRPGTWPNENRVDYERYVLLWAELVTDRVARGDRVHLFVTDPTDQIAVEEVIARLDEPTRAACLVESANTPDDLLEFFRGLDVVISSRLHGVLLAIVAARPVLALSHERKVQAVMKDAGVTPFCADLPTATMDQITERLATLIDQLDPCALTLRQYVDFARTSIRHQEEMLPQLLKRR